MADLLVLPRPAKRLQNGAGFSGKTKNFFRMYCRETSWFEDDPFSRDGQIIVKVN